MELPAGALGSEPDLRLLDEEIEEYDDPLDLDFSQEEPTRRRESKPAGKSPKKRVRQGASITSRAKDLVRAIDPNHVHCLLTGTAEPQSGKQFAHIIARATTALEVGFFSFLSK